MQKEYIQLPPLPADTDVKVVEMAWLFARLERNEQEMVHDLLKNMASGSDMERQAMELSKLLRENAAVGTNPDIMEFAELMKALLGEMIAQSCELAGLVYQCHCVEKKSLEETARETNMDEETLRLIVQYYDLKNAAE